MHGIIKLSPYFKPLFLFFQISARSSLKKFENEKWPKAEYLPLFVCKTHLEIQKIKPAVKFLYNFLLIFFYFKIHINT